MALKPDRQIDLYFNDFFGSATAERGVWVASTSGVNVASGVAADSAFQFVEVATNPSGRNFVGVLLNDIVNRDLSDTTMNRNKSEAQVGDKVAIGREGWFVTNKIAGASSIQPMAIAYAGPTGVFTTVQLLNGQSLTAVGHFMTRPDEQGYCKIVINP